MAGTCLITGSTGYIGANAAGYFVARGWNVHALVRRASASVSGATHHQYRGVYGDVLSAMEIAKPMVVVHLAAHTAIHHSSSDIATLLDANVLFGTQLLEAMTEVGCPRMVTAGTAWQHYEVDDERYRAVNLYAATKQAFDDIARWYADARGLSVASLHLGDTYGPNDPRPKIYALLEEATRTLEPLRLTGGEQVLDPLFVDDATHAIEVAALNTFHGFRVYGVAPGSPIGLRDLVELWCRVNQASPTLSWGARPYREREVMTPWLGGERLPGWNARVSLERGLQLCMESRS